MRILFIEDEKDKKRDIIDYLKHISSESQIDSEESLMSGIIALGKKAYNIVLLDMSLPLYEKGINDENNEFEAFGGLDILDEIVRLDLPSKVIVITAFDVIEDDSNKLTLEELDKEMRTEYAGNYLACIHYDQSSIEWKTALSNWIRGIANESVNS